MLIAVWGVLIAITGLAVAVQRAASGPSLLAYTSVRASQDIMITWPGKHTPSVLAAGPYDESSAAWPPVCGDGCWIAYVRLHYTSWSAPFELITTRPNGTASTNLTPVSAELVSWAWSPDGRTLAADFRTGSSTEIFLFSVDGRQRQNLSDHPAYDFGPIWSPDGQQIAFRSFRGGEANNQGKLFVATLDAALHVTDLRQITDPETADQIAGWSPDGAWLLFSSAVRYAEAELEPDVFIARADGSLTRQLTTHPAPDTNPAWSPDGQRILFESLRDGEPELYTIRPDGSGLINVSDNPKPDTNAAWSPDGQWIVYQTERDPTINLTIVRPDGTDRRALTTHPAADFNPIWSPDGRWIAFESLRAGNRDLFAIRPDGSGLTQLTTYPGVDSSPAWSPPLARSFRLWVALVAVLIMMALAAAWKSVSCYDAANDNHACGGDPDAYFR